jgi:hypothetical protein
MTWLAVMRTHDSCARIESVPFAQGHDSGDGDKRQRVTKNPERKENARQSFFTSPCSFEVSEHSFDPLSAAKAGYTGPINALYMELTTEFDISYVGKGQDI